MLVVIEVEENNVVKDADGNVTHVVAKARRDGRAFLVVKDVLDEDEESLFEMHDDTEWVWNESESNFELEDGEDGGAS